MSAGTSPAIALNGVGPPVIATVQNVVGMDQDTAQDVLALAGLTLGQITRDAHCLDVAGGVATDPLHGVREPPGTAVNLRVSTGTDASGDPCTFK